MDHEPGVLHPRQGDLANENLSVMSPGRRRIVIHVTGAEDHQDDHQHDEQFAEAHTEHVGIIGAPLCLAQSEGGAEGRRS